MASEDTRSHVCQQRNLIFISLGVSALQILLYWGHRLFGVHWVADTLTRLQQATIGWAGELWFIRCYFLLPCVMCGILIAIQLVTPRFFSWNNVILLACNFILAMHGVSCLIVLSR